jgi:hypothetical protein
MEKQRRRLGYQYLLAEKLVGQETGVVAETIYRVRVVMCVDVWVLTTYVLLAQILV